VRLRSCPGFIKIRHRSEQFFLQVDQCYFFCGKILAGFPTTVTLAGTDRVTTAPAPIIAFSPIVIPGRIVQLAPRDAPLQITVLSKLSG